MIAQKSEPARASLRLSLLVVVAAMLATVACQQYTETTVNTKSAANETVVIGALRAIASAQTIYSTTHEGNFGSFDELVNAGNLDARFSSAQPVIGGYKLTMKVTTKDAGGQAPAYAVNADPQQNVAAASTGTRHFYMESSDGLIHANTKQAATASDPPL